MNDDRAALAEVCPDCGVTYKQLVAMCNRHIRPRSEGPGLDALREALAALLDKLDEYLPFEGEEGVMLRYADVLGALLAAGVTLGDEGLATVEDRLATLLADLRKTNDHGQNPQLGEAADHVEAALELVRVWALGIVL